jgi:hypothetical protein
MTKTRDEDPYADLREEAREQALAEFKEIERKSLLAAFLEEERAKLYPKETEPEEEKVSVTIDVPPNMFVNQSNDTGVVINGKAYIHGHTYLVSQALANDLNHLMFRSNLNEKTMGMPNREMNRRKISEVRDGKLIAEASVP